jgi:Dolichyl-phosphate-mannose-protein mannosyltransferase
MKRLAALRVVLLPWIVSRLLSVAVFLVATNPPAGSSRFTKLATSYDGGFYFYIADHGYGSLGVTQPRWAFFPGLPLVIRALDALADPQIGLFVVNQLAFLVALAGVYILARRHSSPRAAVLAVWALAIFPAAFVFSLSYPSSLFLAVTVWAFVLVEDRHDLAAGVLAAGAALLRPNGFVVVIALVVAAPALRRIVLIAAPAVVVLAGWCWYCWDQTGDAFAFLTAKSGWREITVVGLFTAPGKGSALVHALLAVAAIGAVVIRRAHLPRSWLVFTALYLLPSFALGIIGLGRYANECFPAFVAGGQILAGWKPRVATAALVASAVGLAVMAIAVADHGLVP